MEIKTKYDIGDKVWVMTNNRPKEITIAEIEFHAHIYTRNSVKYVDMEGIGYTEQRLFPSKEELLKSL